MATLVLGAAASSLATGVFGYAAGSLAAGVVTGIGVAAGSYIDSRFLFPSKYPRQPNPFKDVQFSPADEGSPLATVFGTARVPLVLMWLSEVREVDSGTGGGKGGPGANVPEFQYFCDAAYAICDGEIEDVERIWANRKQVYSDTGQVLVDAFQPTNAIKTIKKGWSYAIISGTPQYRWTMYFDLTIKSPNGGPDLTDFAIGNTVEMTGWTATYDANNSPNHAGFVYATRYDDATNETYLTLRVGPVHTTTTTLTPPTTPDYFANYAGGGGETIRIFQQNPRWNTKQFSNVRIYQGTPSQSVDPTIDALEPNGTPAFRNTSYILFEDLNLTAFVNALPAQMEARVRKKTGETVQGVIEAVCASAGLDESEVDASACSAIAFTGMHYLGAQPAGGTLDSVLLAYDIIHQNRDGVLTFFPRDQAPDIDVEENDLACHEIQGDTPRDIAVSDTPAALLSRELNLSYRDPNRKNQVGTQRIRRADPRFRRVSSLDLPIVMESDYARSVGGRLLWLEHVNSRNVTVQLPPSYISAGVRESSRISFPSRGRDYTVLLREIDRGDNFMLNCRGVLEDPRLLNQPAISSSAGTDGSRSLNAGRTPPALNFEFVDVGCLRDEHVDQPGWYFAVTYPGESTGNSAVCVLYESVDGTEYREVARPGVRATMGRALSVLSSAAVPGFWDDASEVDVLLDFGELENVTDLQCLNGANRAVWGNEVIAFAGAELAAANTYRLTRLQRGLQGTEGEIANHFVGDRVVILTKPGVEFVATNSAGVGADRWYKVVPPGGRLVDATAVQFQGQGSTVRPLAPVNITVTRDGSNNATIGFTRRGRGVSRLFSTAPVPIHEGRIAYFVDAMDPVDPTVLARRMTVVSNEFTLSQAYSAADQTTDGYTPGDPINLRLTQVSAWLGTGQVKELTA